MIEHSEELLQRIQDLMGKQGEYYKKYVCREINGEPTLTLTMALGDKLDDDEVMSIPAVDDDDMSLQDEQDKLFSQDKDDVSFSPKAKRRKKYTAKEKRSSTQSAQEGALFIWKCYYTHEDSPYFHQLSREMYTAIMTRYENQTPERSKVIEKLKKGDYPSLDWMVEDNLLDPAITPGQQQWPPTNDTRGYMPPLGVPRKKAADPSSQFREDSTTFMKQMKDILTATTTSAPGAVALKGVRAVRFIKGKYHVSLLPGSFESCKTGEDLIEKAATKASATKQLVFWYSADEMESLRENQAQIFYEFNGIRLSAEQFEEAPIEQILFVKSDNVIEIRIVLEVVEDLNTLPKDGGFIYKSK